MSDKPDLKQSMTTYKENMKEDLAALWKVWVPSTFINFAFMPMWARIPWVAGTSLIWTCILSALRGGDVAHKQDIEAPSQLDLRLNWSRRGSTNWQFLQVLLIWTDHWPTSA